MFSGGGMYADFPLVVENVLTFSVGGAGTETSHKYLAYIMQNT